jgi:hypothetical protein
MNGEPRPRTLTTADLVASAQNPEEHERALAADHGTRSGDDKTTLAPLFTGDVAKDFRSRWDIVQRGFVDDPKEAVRAGDELVAQVIKSLAETFSNQRAAIEGDQADQASTENLRLALRRYRSFFERLLSI